MHFTLDHAKKKLLAIIKTKNDLFLKVNLTFDLSFFIFFPVLLDGVLILH